MKITERISRLLTLGMYDKLTKPQLPENLNNYVVAGNPGKSNLSFPEPLILPNEFKVSQKTFSVKDFFQYTVVGNSMSPDGICNGYELLAVSDLHEIETGDFIIIAVDNEFYKYRHHGRVPFFHLKLRRAIKPISPKETFEQLESYLIGTFAESFTDKEKEDLKDSLNEARIFYSDRELFLSVTYHNGDIHYSFHPVENISYKVEFVAYSCKENIEIRRVSALYN